MSKLLGCVNLSKYQCQNGSYTIRAMWRTDEGQHSEQVLKTPPNTNKRELRKAEAEARKICREIQESYYSTRHRSRMALDKAVESYLAWAYGTGMNSRPPVAASTADRQARVLKSFLAFIGNGEYSARQAGQISNQHTANWVDFRMKAGAAPSSMITYLSDLESFFSFCINRNWLREGQITLKRQRRLIAKQVENKETVIPELDQILKACTENDDREIFNLIFTTLACTGLRCQELQDLKGLHLVKGVINVPRSDREKTKLHKREIPIGPRLIKKLSRLKKIKQADDYLFTDRYKPLGNAISHRAKKFELTPHDFRRWFNATLENLECPMDTRMDLMGHTMSKVRAAYSAGVSNETKLPWLKKIENKLINT